MKHYDIKNFKTGQLVENFDSLDEAREYIKDKPLLGIVECNLYAHGETQKAHLKIIADRSKSKTTE